MASIDAASTAIFPLNCWHAAADGLKLGHRLHLSKVQVKVKGSRFFFFAFFKVNLKGRAGASAPAVFPTLFF